MRTKRSGLRTGRASRATHLSLAPEPDAVAGIPVPSNLPDYAAYAYRLGRITSLAEELDERTRAMANFERFESMSFGDIETLIEVLGWFRDAKRPSLRLVDETDDITPIVEAAISEIRPVPDETAGGFAS